MLFCYQLPMTFSTNPTLVAAARVDNCSKLRPTPWAWPSWKSGTVDGWNSASLEAGSWSHPRWPGGDHWISSINGGNDNWYFGRNYHTNCACLDDLQKNTVLIFKRTNKRSEHTNFAGNASQISGCKCEERKTPWVLQTIHSKLKTDSWKT